jgi:hypothetical protein
VVGNQTVDKCMYRLLQRRRNRHFVYTVIL